MRPMESQNGKVFEFPNTAACRICRFQFSDYCPACLQNNLADFEPKQTDLAHLPAFTLQEFRELPGKVKGELLALYIIAIMEAIEWMKS